MKVRVVLNIEVDPEAWDLTFGTGTRAKAISDDVREWVLTQIRDSSVVTDEVAAVVELGR